MGGRLTPNKSWIGAPADEWGEREAENQAYLVLTTPPAIEIMAVLRSFLPLSYFSVQLAAPRRSSRLVSFRFVRWVKFPQYRNRKQASKQAFHVLDLDFGVFFCRESDM
jgi:hypothetical protein